jgi:hypothetical protein
MSAPVGSRGADATTDPLTGSEWPPLILGPESRPSVIRVEDLVAPVVLEWRDLPLLRR